VRKLGVLSSHDTIQQKSELVQSVPPVVLGQVLTWMQLPERPQA
jgi:hypothetical protein